MFSFVLLRGETVRHSLNEQIMKWVSITDEANRVKRPRLVCALGPVFVLDSDATGLCLMGVCVCVCGFFFAFMWAVGRSSIQGTIQTNGGEKHLELRLKFHIASKDKLPFYFFSSRKTWSVVLAVKPQGASLREISWVGQCKDTLTAQEIKKIKVTEPITRTPESEQNRQKSHFCNVIQLH